MSSRNRFPIPRATPAPDLLVVTVHAHADRFGAAEDLIRVDVAAQDHPGFTFWTPCTLHGARRVLNSCLSLVRLLKVNRVKLSVTTDPATRDFAPLFRAAQAQAVKDAKRALAAAGMTGGKGGGKRARPANSDEPGIKPTWAQTVAAYEAVAIAG